MKDTKRRLLVLLSLIAAGLVATAAAFGAPGVTPGQLRQAGWTCIRPLADPARLICDAPGLGLPPLPGTPGFADRRPSYELLVFDYESGTLIGIQHLLRPDVYLHGTPPCPQQPGGRYVYIPRNDTYGCLRTV